MTKAGDQNRFEWPRKARIAVVVTCLLENWSEGKGPPFSVQTTALKPGTPDRASMTWGTYGGRAGVWRLLKILDANMIPATFAANARALELNPGVAEQIIKSGHEICAHSYLQDTILAYLSRDEERDRHPQDAGGDRIGLRVKLPKDGSAQCWPRASTLNRLSPKRASYGTAITITSTYPFAFRSVRGPSWQSPIQISRIIAFFAAIQGTGTTFIRTHSIISIETNRRRISTLPCIVILAAGL